MRAPGGPSCKAADAKRPSKKLKCEKRSLAKLETQGANIGGSTSSSPFLKESATTRTGGNRCLAYSPVFKMMLQSEGKGIPKMSDEMQADQADFCVEPSAPDTNRCFPKADGGALFQSHIQEVEEKEEEEEEGEEGSCGAEFSDSSEMEPEELQSQVFEMDNSAFLNEDSNQPLPVDRFFGSVAFLQDIPAAPLARATASRREFRKLHFIAKDEDEDDDGEDVV
ncbi:UPF0688 protein C1orf174 homolog [Tiliqua scincoides]|uniref:UPF0688 protein C1orf174 homolog n=1 Tax=Tiliqua scincoides TaxID=71010 RepID=UPI003462ECC1